MAATTAKDGSDGVKGVAPSHQGTSEDAKKKDDEQGGGSVSGIPSSSVASSATTPPEAAHDASGGQGMQGGEGGGQILDSGANLNLQQEDGATEVEGSEGEAVGRGESFWYGEELDHEAVAAAWDATFRIGDEEGEGENDKEEEGEKLQVEKKMSQPKKTRGSSGKKRKAVDNLVGEGAMDAGSALEVVEEKDGAVVVADDDFGFVDTKDKGEEEADGEEEEDNEEDDLQDRPARLQKSMLDKMLKVQAKEPESLADWRDHFELRVIDVNRTAKVTLGGKLISFTAFVVCGNYFGAIGFGKGKGKEVAAAIERAYSRALRNMHYFERYGGRSIPAPVVGKFEKTKVYLWPGKPESGMVAGPIVGGILRLAGFVDVKSKVVGSRHPVNTVKATFKALSLSAAASPRRRRMVVLPDDEGSSRHDDEDDEELLEVLSRVEKRPPQSPSEAAMVQ